VFLEIKFHPEKFPSFFHFMDCPDINVGKKPVCRIILEFTLISMFFEAVFIHCHWAAKVLKIKPYELGYAEFIEFQ
jgi:hypothetical protein